MPDAAFGAPVAAPAPPPNPFSSYLNNVAADQTGTQNSVLNILGQVLGSGAGALAGSELQLSAAGQQFGLDQRQLGLTDANLVQQAGNQFLQLGIQNQQLDLSNLGLQQQGQLLGVTTGLEQQEYAQQQTQYPEQLQQAAVNYGVNKQNLLGNLGATGATNTVGAHAQEGLLAQNYGWQTQDINRAQTLSQLQQKGTEAQQNYSAEQLANQQKNLQLIAESNGLSQQEVIQQLDYSLQQAGANFESAGPQLLSQIGNILNGDLTSAQSAAAALGLVNSGIQMINPSVQQ